MGLTDRPASPACLTHTSDKHPRVVLNEVSALRRHRELCDVVLNVGSRKIFAHRVVLSACSPYFRAMFTGELAESRQAEVREPKSMSGDKLVKVTDGVHFVQHVYSLVQVCIGAPNVSPQQKHK